MAERISKKRIKKIEEQVKRRKEKIESVLPGDARFPETVSLPYRNSLVILQAMEGLINLIRAEKDYFSVRTVSGDEFKFNIEG